MYIELPQTPTHSECYTLPLTQHIKLEAPPTHINKKEAHRPTPPTHHYTPPDRLSHSPKHTKPDSLFPHSQLMGKPHPFSWQMWRKV